MCFWQLTLILSCTNPCPPIIDPAKTVVFACDTDATASLDAAYNSGRVRMIYIHDSKPRVVARRGKKRWGPRNPSRPFTGPAWAAEFIAERGYR